MTDLKDSPNSFPWPPFLTIGMLLLCYLLTRFLPLGWEPEDIPSIMPPTGYMIAGLAIALDIWTFVTFSKFRSNIMPHRAATKLLTSGPFSFSRNPIYLANVMLVVGAGFVLGSRWFLIGAAVLFILLQQLAIKREEKHMSINFPQEWQEYTLRVRRWI